MDQYPRIRNGCFGILFYPCYPWAKDEKKNSKISHQHISFEYDDKTNDNHQLKVLPADVLVFWSYFEVWLEIWYHSALWCLRIIIGKQLNTLSVLFQFDKVITNILETISDETCSRHLFYTIIRNQKKTTSMRESIVSFAIQCLNNSISQYVTLKIWNRLQFLLLRISSRIVILWHSWIYIWGSNDRTHIFLMPQVSSFFLTPCTATCSKTWNLIISH